MGPPAGPRRVEGLARRGRNSAAADVQAPAELLGEYLPLLADVAINGRRPDAFERAVDLYLSATWRPWRQPPVVVRSSDPEKVRRAEAVLRVLDDAIGVLVDGRQSERREMIRRGRRCARSSSTTCCVATLTPR